MKLRHYITLLLVTLALTFLVSQVKVYNGLNKGIVVGHCGVELVGSPGFFCDTE